MNAGEKSRIVLFTQSQRLFWSQYKYGNETTRGMFVQEKTTTQPDEQQQTNRETHKLLLLNLKGINEVIILCRIKCTLTDCHFLSPPQPPPVALDSFFRDFSAGPSLTDWDRQTVGRVQFNFRNIKISKDHKSPPRTYFIVDVYCNNLINLRLCSWLGQNGQPSPSFTQV